MLPAQSGLLHSAGDGDQAGVVYSRLLATRFFGTQSPLCRDNKLHGIPAVVRFSRLVRLMLRGLTYLSITPVSSPRYGVSRPPVL